MQNLCLGEQKSREKEEVVSDTGEKTSQVHIETTVILDKGLCVRKGRKKLCLNSKIALSLVEELYLIMGFFFP